MSEAATDSPSRKAQRLAESQELDQKISAETDALREEIKLKNKEIEMKSRDLNRLVSENKILQAKLKLLTDPATEYSLIIDQGGGSFSAYLFAQNPTQKDVIPMQLEKYKSVKLVKLADVSLSKQIEDALGNSMHHEDGSMNDYSFADPEHYPLITQWFAAFYRAIEKKVIESYGFIGKRTVRQTGKIRAVLMQPGKEAQRKIWYDSFNAALGKEWDYRLLTNEEEAEIEGLAFYHFSGSLLDSLVPQYNATNYVGLGIGSSSTQGYYRNDKNQIIVGFDSIAGAKPNKQQSMDGKAGNWRTPEEFCEQYKKILRPIVASNSLNKCIVATNAIGYLAALLTHPTKVPDWPKKEAFKAAVSKGLPVPCEVYQSHVQSYIDTCGANWESNFLLGFLNACASFQQTEMVMMEQKQHNGKGLPVETSWVLYLAQTGGSNI